MCFPYEHTPNTVVMSTLVTTLFSILHDIICKQSDNLPKTLNLRFQMSNTPDTDLGISVLQHVPEPQDIEAALHRLEQAACTSAEQGSSLLLTPECGISGYDMSIENAESVAISKDSLAIQQIAQIAKHHSIAIMFGFIEHQSGLQYNSAMLIDDKGEPLLHYRKTHLWGELDRQLFTAGDRLAPVVNYKGWLLSTLICYDVEFPETVRALTLSGAQIILVPTALMTPFRFVAEKMVPVRAAENQIFLAYANLVGRERDTVYEGCSTVADPEGNVLVKAPHEEAALLHTVLHADTLAQTRRAIPYHLDRRPELYGSLGKIK